MFKKADFFALKMGLERGEGQRTMYSPPMVDPKKEVRKEIPANTGRARLNLSGIIDVIKHIKSQKCFI